MKIKPTDTTASYKVLRDKYVAFVLKDSEIGCEFITIPVNTPDDEAVRIAQSTPSGDWRKVETIHFDSIQSNAAPESENRSE